MLEVKNPRTFDSVRGEVHFDDVKFSSGDEPVLSDIDLTIQPG